MWTMAKSPLSFSPCRRNLRSPRASWSSARHVAEQFEIAAVPQHHAAAAVVARGDVALEIAVLHGVIFHVRGEVL